MRDFDFNLGTYYGIMQSFNPDVVLVGSTTAKSGIVEKIPEKEDDWIKPIIKRGDKRFYWVMVDSRARLKGLLHIYRSSGYCKDVIVLISKKTPRDYIKYLKERNYRYHIRGKERVNIKSALAFLYKKYRARRIVTDTGGTLSSLLLEQGLVDKISLLISPALAGNMADNLFRKSKTKAKLNLIRSNIIDKNYVHLIYKVKK